MNFEDFRRECLYHTCRYDPRPMDDEHICNDPYRLINKSSCQEALCPRYKFRNPPVQFNNTATSIVDTPYNITMNIATSIVDEQDEIIMRKIQEIGGEKFAHVTIDKSKVVDMLGKYIPQMVKTVKLSDTFADMNVFICPGCENILAYGRTINHCPECGQTLKWREE